MCLFGERKTESDNTALTLVVPVMTIALAITFFEVIPMKNIMSISTKQE